MFQINQNNFIILIPLISLVFLTTYIITKKLDNKKFFLLLTSIVLICFLFTPNLTNDIYRYLWDGAIIQNKINPYDFTPKEIINKNILNDKYHQFLFNKIDKLSQNNYSCYPIVSQIYFYLSSFTNNFYFNVIILKILFITSIYIGIIFFFNLLKLLNIEKLNSYNLFLNPLFIVEGIQNLHLESIMLTFIILFLFYLMKGKLFIASLFLAFAIQIKLIPIFLLIFTLRYLILKKWLLLNFFTLTLVVFISFSYININNYKNFTKSVNLYFSNFEFNSFIFHWYILYGEWKYLYNRVITFGPQLARISSHIILFFAWFGSNFSFNKMIFRLLLATTMYYFLSSTVHPWYIIFPLFLSSFTKLKFVLIWSYVVFLSYYSYSLHYNENNMRILFIIEYLTIIIFLIRDLFLTKKLYY